MNKYFLFPALIVGDVLTKRYFHNDHTDHFTHRNAWIAVGFSILALLLVWGYDRRYMPVALLCITGVVLNTIDSLDGVVGNPFVIGIGGIAVVFNLADVAIISCLLWLFYETWRPRVSVV